MREFILFMHDDAVPGETSALWADYFEKLRASGRFNGGSAIGDGACFRKEGEPGDISGRLTGFIRITAKSLSDAQTFLAGNPVFEAGGTVEIRELPEGE